MRTQEVDTGEIGRMVGVSDVSLYLITNLDFVTIHTVRTMTHALVLNPKGERARGFGVCASIPTFDVEAPVFKEMKFVKIGDSTTYLTVGSGSDFQLRLDHCGAATDNEVKVDVVFGDVDYAKLWGLLERRVRESWDAPGMPHVVWGRK